MKCQLATEISCDCEKCKEAKERKWNVDLPPHPLTKEKPK